MSQTSFILKGTGWYVTDYARKEKGRKGDKEEGSKADKPKDKDKPKDQGKDKVSKEQSAA